MASLILRHKSNPIDNKPYLNLLNFTHTYSFSSSSNSNDENTSADSKTIDAFAEIRKSLTDFRRRSSQGVSPPNVNRRMPKPPTINPNPNPKPNPSFQAGNLSILKIRESLKNLRGRNSENNTNFNKNAQLSLNSVKQSFYPRPVSSENKTTVIGGTSDSLPMKVFEKEMKEKEGNYGAEDKERRYELVRLYSHKELGEQLKKLRPDTSNLSTKNKRVIKQGEDGWFSLSELQQRLGKLKVINVKNADKNAGVFFDVRQGIQNIEQKPKAVPKVSSLLTQSPSPPKEHLIEKYFHPDNMSAAEKLKIELKKVRDEFKMSESDCGSTRVQIAQLTTEIKHLSSMLHKKDKHSRVGLQAKVQRRKKLLKYLRRTDWDSYCFVLSKLGLRDNPDYKN